jgi:hypothetical protein
MWGPMVGNVAHNLRSALDYIPFALAVENGYDGDAWPRPSFPLFESRAAYEQSGGGAAQSLCHVPEPTHETFEYFQPFHSNDRPEQGSFSVLKELSDKDKHKLIPPVYPMSDLELSPSALEFLGFTGFKDKYDVILPDTVRSKMPEKVEPQIHVDVAFEIPFRPGLGRVGVAELGDIHRLVRDEVIPRFERFFE